MNINFEKRGELFRDAFEYIRKAQADFPIVQNKNRKTNKMKKTILITGSTDGIGKLAAIKLAQDGHEIYVHGRNAEELDAVIAEIKSSSMYQQVQIYNPNSILIIT